MIVRELSETPDLVASVHEGCPMSPKEDTAQGLGHLLGCISPPFSFTGMTSSRVIPVFHCDLHEFNAEARRNCWTP